MGHGSQDGLFAGVFRLMIDSSFVQFLRQKTHNMFIWCNADQFVQKYDLQGHYTGMIISDPQEADYFDVPYTLDTLAQSNDQFAQIVKYAALNRTVDSVDRMKDMYDLGSAVCYYNRTRIYYQ